MKSQPRQLTRIRRQSKVVSGLLKQFSHPQRLLILCFLADGEKSVSHIEAACGASQSSVSQFLKAMRLEGLLETRREGKKIFYKIADDRIHKLMDACYQIFCK